MKVPPNKPHFFKPIHQGFKNGLKIPVGFLKYLKGHEQENVVLRRAGKKWLVKLNGRQLEEGWGKFAEEHDLQLGDVLVFRHEGDMEFEVNIFDSSHCDREYPEYLQEEAKARTVLGTSKKVVKDKPKPRITSSSKSFRRAEASSHNHFCQSHVEFTIKPYCLSNGYFWLPKKFATANGLTNKNCGLIIRDGRQRSWNFRIYTSCAKVYVGGKWAKFCVANDLQVGDHIRCEVVTKGENPIWKFHVEADKPNTRFASSSKAFRRAEASTHNHFGHCDVEFTVKPYCLSSGHFHMKCANRYKPFQRLPKDFAMANGFTNKKCGLIIRDERQRSWNFRLYTSYSNVYVGGKWGKFCVANDLQVGDHIRCEVVSNGEKPIWKFHDLRGSPSLQPEVKKNNLEDKRISDKGLHFQEQTDLKIKTSDVTAPKSQVPASTSSDDVNPYFISTIKPYIITNTVLYLPMAFAKSNGLINRNEMILVDEKRRSWSVHLGQTGTHFVIKSNGWTQFMKANGVQVGDSYKFELINNGSDGTKPIAHFYYLGGSPLLQPEVKKNNLEDKRMSNKGLHFQEQTDLMIKTSDVTAPISQIPASTSADDANPHFISTIKPYIITNPVLYLPMAFAKSNGLMNRTEMILVDEKRRSWSVNLGPAGSHFVIKRGGWTEFMKANDIRVGDTYKFELINNGTIPMAYFHCNYSGRDDRQHRSH